ncbi:restriction endonuclease subunit S [Lactobacillus gasseri]|uniref:restriction endonuclease subunit S n=1 Tax=Lactobacillus gasseri TaxID=1596 RepID=UPI001E639892|nr:restriction endonuclease subunit S [Lactobacillus gasseri]UFN98412.1 restriction endonuclease subunit S [Lactobacillus gasseri]
MKYKEIGDSLYIKGRIGWKGLKKSEYLKNSDYRIINGSNIFDNKIDWSNCGYISEERYNESPEIMLQKGDILITKDGTIGKVAMVSELKKPTTVASGLFVLRNTAPSKWDTKYIFNFLQSNKFKKFVFSRTEGSVIPHLYQKDFMTLEIPELEINEQRKIAYRLDTIQHKLDLNNQINDNLDALLTTIFEKQINNKSFKEANLTDIATYKNGLAMQKYRPKNNEKSLPVLKIRELNQGHTDDSSDRCSIKIDKNVIVNIGDIIFSWSGTLLVKNWSGKRAGLNQHLFKVTSNSYPDWFIYEWTKYYLRKFQSIAAGKATTMGHIKRSDLKSSKVRIPNESKLVELNTIMQPLYDKRIEVIKENQQLIELKQVLLQKFF